MLSQHTLAKSVIVNRTAVAAHLNLEVALSQNHVGRGVNGAHTLRVP